jgi:hypothetical protein
MRFESIDKENEECSSKTPLAVVAFSELPEGSGCDL